MGENYYPFVLVIFQNCTFFYFFIPFSFQKTHITKSYFLFFHFHSSLLSTFNINKTKFDCQISGVMDVSNVMVLFYHYGLSTDLKTSWSNENPERRFLDYRKYGLSSAFRFFNWYDPPMNDRAKSMLRGLLKKKNHWGWKKERMTIMDCWFKVLFDICLVKMIV